VFVLGGRAVKWCKGCLQWKPIDAFYRHPETKDGRDPRCKRCHHERRMERLKLNIEYVRARERAYRKLPHVHEQRMDYQRLRRFRKRQGSTE
jgi:hypothetical protein